MKKLIESLPFILLLALTGFSFYQEPNLAQSLILIAVAALSGYRYYSMDQAKPDYLTIFQERLDTIDAVHSAEKKAQSDQIIKEMKIVTEELNTLRARYGKLTLAQQQREAVTQSKW